MADKLPEKQKTSLGDPGRQAARIVDQYLETFSSSILPSTR
jgi:hypothetical protein